MTVKPVTKPIILCNNKHAFLDPYLLATTGTAYKPSKVSNKHADISGCCETVTKTMFTMLKPGFH